MLAAYSGSGVTMSECHQLLWVQKAASSTGTPKLFSLPPTTESFVENMIEHTSKLQNGILHWIQSHHLLICRTGWKADGINKSLSAVPVPTGVLLAPDYIIRLIQCDCESVTACRSGKSYCTGQQIPCTIFCACSGGTFCFNKFTSKPPEDDDDNGDIV